MNESPTRTRSDRGRPLLAARRSVTRTLLEKPTAPQTATSAQFSVLFVIGAQNFGGAERQLAALAKGLHAKGHRVVVALCYPGEPLRRELVNAGLRVADLERHGRWGPLGFAVRAIRLLRAERPDVVHGYLAGPNLLAILLRPFHRQARIVWGIRQSNMDMAAYEWWHRWRFKVNGWLGRFADLIIVNSDSGAAHHQEHGYPGQSMVTVPNGIDTQRFSRDQSARQRIRSEWGIGDGERVVGLVARVHPMKDHATFLRSAALVRSEVENVRFVCVGAGEPEFVRSLKELAEDVGVGDVVSWIGARGDMEAVYNAFDVVCSSSAFGEGFSNTIGEAMACGVPCVVTDVGDSARVVGDTGVVVPPGNPEALAAGIRQVVDDTSGHRHQRCRERIENLFSVVRLVEQSEQLLLKVQQQ